ncbi:MAG: aldo/keto reductase [Deltaproteobacteria bacterium]|jgi:predicted aldo/keto reductase-like oxidoreductase|nr:aldo/keto reductase [Deltaproteobacteria bacterium]MBW2540687.1 aldo/keto reductase [Deltaproteobacteria bacterium]
MAGSPKDREADRDRPELDDDGAGIDRRTFLQQGGRAALGIGAFGVAYAARAASLPADAPTIQKYVPLGKTGLMISDIGFGSSGCPSADIVRHCYDRGMNYFDTAEGYGTKGWNDGGYVENFLGEALHDKRDKVVITTKYYAEAKDDRKLIMTKLEESLQRLRTDYVDVYLNHSVNDLDRLKNPEWFEFVELAKKQGKIRFSGMSGHGGQLQECAEYAIDHDMADVILCSHNFGSDPKFYERFMKKFDWVANQAGIRRLFKKAHDKGIGVIAMKTQMGAKLNDLSAYEFEGAALPEASLRWVLSDPNVDAAIISMTSTEVADSYIRASGKRGMRHSDLRVLEQYVVANSSDYCRPGCSGCASACPAGVPIADVLRQRMYAKRYGNQPLARTGYAALGQGASACLGCSGEPCANACEFGLEIAALTRETASMLRA